MSCWGSTLPCSESAKCASRATSTFESTGIPLLFLVRQESGVRNEPGATDKSPSKIDMGGALESLSPPPPPLKELGAGLPLPAKHYYGASGHSLRFVPPRASVAAQRCAQRRRQFWAPAGSAGRMGGKRPQHLERKYRAGRGRFQNGDRLLYSLFPLFCTI